MAVSNPIISNYKPFYIQVGPSATASDTRAEWGLIAKTNPYPALPNPKDPYKNEWLDEDGDEEYLASMRYASFEFTVGFYIRATSATDVRTAMASFFRAIKAGEFRIYDSYTGIGRRKVRYAGFEEEMFKSDAVFARCIFNVTFKCNDPISFLVLSGDNLVTPYNAVVSSAASTAGKTCSITGFTLTEGAQVSLKFTHGNSAISPTLSINSGAAKGINGLPTSGLSTSLYYLLEYNGTTWDYKGYV